MWREPNLEKLRVSINVMNGLPDVSKLGRRRYLIKHQYVEESGVLKMLNIHASIGLRNYKNLGFFGSENRSADVSVPIKPLFVVTSVFYLFFIFLVNPD